MRKVGGDTAASAERQEAEDDNLLPLYSSFLRFSTNVAWLLKIILFPLKTAARAKAAVSICAASALPAFREGVFTAHQAITNDGWI